MPTLETWFELKTDIAKLTSQRDALERGVEQLQQQHLQTDRAWTAMHRQRDEQALAALSERQQALDRRQHDLAQREADVVTRETAVAWVDERTKNLEQREQALLVQQQALDCALAEAHARAQAWQERQKELDVKAAELARREAGLPPQD